MSIKTQVRIGNNLSPLARAVKKVTNVSKSHFGLGAEKSVVYTPHANIDSFGVGGCGFPIHLNQVKEGGKEHVV